MKLYLDLMKAFHPDVSKHPESHRRTILINQNKNNEIELYRLSILWDVLKEEKKISLSRISGDASKYDCFIFRTDIYLKNHLQKYSGGFLSVQSELPGFIKILCSSFNDAYYVINCIIQPNMKFKVFA
jgi:hypothetical protein